MIHFLNAFEHLEAIKGLGWTVAAGELFEATHADSAFGPNLDEHLSHEDQPKDHQGTQAVEILQKHAFQGGSFLKVGGQNEKEKAGAKSQLEQIFLEHVNTSLYQESSLEYHERMKGDKLGKT